jgi:hypothetical protein
MAGSKLKEITKPKLLLVEGNDEVRLFNALLKHLKLQDTISVEPMGGIKKLRVQLQTVLKRTGHEKLESLAIVRVKPGSDRRA